MALQRYLSHRETLTIGDGESIEFEYTGFLDKQTLRRAIDLLGVKHPLLRGRTRMDADGVMQIYVPDGVPCKLEVIAGEHAEHEHLRKAFICQPWDPQSGVVKFGLIHGNDRGLLIVRVDHGVTGGKFIMLVMRDLWQIYTSLIRNDQDIKISSPKSLPATFEELIEKHFTDWSFVGKFPDLDRMRLRIRPRNRRIVLNEEATSDLRMSARSCDISVHGLLCGAIMAAQRDWVADRYPYAPKKAFPMVCVSPVDLRGRADRASDVQDATKLTVQHHAKVLVEAHADMLEISRNVVNSIQSAINRRELIFGMSNTEELQSSAPEVAMFMDKYPEPFLLSASISNIGAFGKFDLPDGLNVHMKGDLNAVYDLPCYSAWTVEKRFTLVGAFAREVFSDETTDGVMNKVAANLCQLGIPSASVST